MNGCADSKIGHFIVTNPGNSLLLPAICVLNWIIIVLIPFRQDLFTGSLGMTDDG